MVINHLRPLKANGRQQLHKSRQRGAVVRSVVFMTARLVVQLPTYSLVVASLDKMLHDDYLCLVESGKQQIKKREFTRKTWKQGQLLSEFGFVLRTGPTPLFRDRRIKMKKSNQNQMKIQLKLSLLSRGPLLLRVSRGTQTAKDWVHWST